MSMRIGGLASGMDIDQMVNDLMKAERVKVDRLEQDKQIIQWKQEIYNDLNNDFANFILDTKKELGLISSSSTGVLTNNSVSSLNWVKGATVSDDKIAEAKAYANAVEGSYDVKVTQLADNFSVASTGDLAEVKDADGNLKSLKDHFNLNDTDVIEFTITRIEDGNNTVSHTFSYSGEDLNNKTIQDIVNDINNYQNEDKKDLGIKAIYDENINRFFLQSTESGANNGFTVTENAGTNNIINFMTGVDGSNQPTNKLNLQLKSGDQNKGQDAIIDFGAAIGVTQSSNQFTINNIELNLKAEGDFTVKVETDIDAVYEKINKFVEKYNELYEKLTDKLGEKRYRDYRPLTEEQKEAMSEKEIELWEEKAKSGLVKSDSILERTVQSMRRGLYEKVEGVIGSFNQITEIGIDTEKYTRGSSGGKLVIDERKLKEAIKDDVDGVLELLFKQPSSDLTYKPESQMTLEEINQKRSESGLISRLFDNIVSGMSDIVNKSGTGENTELYRKVDRSILIDFITDHKGISMLEKDTKELDRRIDDMNDYLIRTEDRYWRQFTAMEKAINQMNQQSLWLMQQFGGGGQ